MEQQILMSWMTAIQSKMYDCERRRVLKVFQLNKKKEKKRLCMCMMTEMLVTTQLEAHLR